MAFLRSVSAPDAGPVVYGESVHLRFPHSQDYAAWYSQVPGLKVVDRCFDPTMREIEGVVGRRTEEVTADGDQLV
jgi:hypothetical protein